jgi:hypothetical protein
MKKLGNYYIDGRNHTFYLPFHYPETHKDYTVEAGCEWCDAKACGCSQCGVYYDEHVVAWKELSIAMSKD